MDMMTVWIEQATVWLVALVQQLGVAGIFIMTFLESTFVPVPSEITMVPAGYLVQQGRMDLASVWIASVVGTVAGSYFNYWIAKHFGRGLFLRYGQYFFMTPEKLEKLEYFFRQHGPISIFTGRLIPGVRHCISFPAGLARMQLNRVLLYTACGGALWMSVLLVLGYYIGANQALVVQYVPLLKLAVLAFVMLMAGSYILHHRRRTRRARP